MDPTLKTIGFLRGLTFDGMLSGEEVWLLAKFLNENPDCAEEWPGYVLYPMLHMSFDDGELTESEMELVAHAIAAVEHQWLLRKPAGDYDRTEVIPVALPPLAKPILPSLDVKVEVPSSKEEVAYQVDLMEHSCTCPDWQRRDHWPVGHPGRCCRHVAFAFGEVHSGLEAHLHAVLHDCLQRGTGTHPEDDWLMVPMRNGKPAVISGGSGDWCNVYIPFGGKYERYGYNRKEQRWAYGDAPPASLQISAAIAAHFEKAVCP